MCIRRAFGRGDCSSACTQSGNCCDDYQYECLSSDGGDGGELPGELYGSLVESKMNPCEILEVACRT